MAGRPLLLGLICALVSADLESTRLEWERAHHDLSRIADDDGVVGERLRAQLEIVTDELRRRIGGTYTLRELAEEYIEADVWAREALAEHPTPGWERTLTLVEGAAFHLYARGAVDYAP